MQREEGLEREARKGGRKAGYEGSLEKGAETGGGDTKGGRAGGGGDERGGRRRGERSTEKIGAGRGRGGGRRCEGRKGWMRGERGERRRVGFYRKKNSILRPHPATQTAEMGYTSKATNVRENSIIREARDKIFVGF